MLQELLSILRPGNPLSAMGDEFSEMLGLTYRMTVIAGDLFFGKPVAPEARSGIYDRDVKVNKLERRIRKRVVAHLSVGGNKLDLPYCLLLMSLVKDVERIGDYAKNLSEIVDISSGSLPDDEIVAELRELRIGVEETFKASGEVFTSSDRERALSMIHKGKADAQRADALLQRIAKSSYNGSTTTALVLGTRYYKRIGGHLINLSSSVIMPLHKVDYYDEDEIPKGHS